jgi:hypothetical protein
MSAVAVSAGAGSSWQAHTILRAEHLTLATKLIVKITGVITTITTAAAAAVIVAEGSIIVIIVLMVRLIVTFKASTKHISIKQHSSIVPSTHIVAPSTSTTLCPKVSLTGWPELLPHLPQPRGKGAVQAYSSTVLSQ